MSLSHIAIEGGIGDFHPNNILRLAISVANANILDCFAVKGVESGGTPKIAIWGDGSRGTTSTSDKICFSA